MAYIAQVTDARAMEQVEALLHREGIRRDAHLDYTCALYDGGRIVATGSCFRNTLRCFAVDHDHRGEGLLNQVVTHLIQVQFERGYFHLFLYTSCDAARLFSGLGFYEIARVEQKLVFMENRRTGFRDYLRGLSAKSGPGKPAAAIVMNANPFTLGHRYLVERAAAENDTVHLFVLSEDASLVPFDVRWKLVTEGVAHLPNVICHRSGPYLISAVTFPSYFLKDEAAVIQGHARLDLTLFGSVAKALDLSARYVGEEPTSQVTGLYNQIMVQELPKMGLACVVVPRLETGGDAVSASTVRRLIHDGHLEDIRPLVPETTWAYFTSPEAKPVIRAIRAAGEVVHY